MSGHNSNGKLVVKLLGVAVGMFVFGVFLMPPLYVTFCELTGLNQAGVKTAAQAPSGEAAESRTVKILFDATTNSSLNWAFGPLERTMEVTVGAPSEAFYFAENRETESVGGMATFNVAPATAARYFVKVECFCFSRQVLAGGERREMPVYFFIQPDLPEDITELTLSYTFFNNDDPGVAQITP
mgnify:CR=1 FL=1